MVSVVVKVNIVKVLKSVTQWSVATLRRILEWAVALETNLTMYCSESMVNSKKTE